MLLALSMPGWPEIIVILLLILVFFGAKRLPELARGLAQSLNEFRKAKDEFDQEIHRSASDLTIKEAKEKQPHAASSSNAPAPAPSQPSSSQQS